MLTASLTIIDNTIAAKDFLIAKRPKWADPFLPDMIQRILDTFSAILGVDNVKALTRQTSDINVLRKVVLKDIAEFKVQLKNDFAKDKRRFEELRNLLGFKNPGATLQKYSRSQEALTQHLQRLNTGLTTELRTELETKGMSPDTLNNITARQ